MPDPVPLPSRRTWTIWGIILLLLDGWVAVRMGIFDLTARVTLDGQTIDVLNTFATVDHPFHATRAATLLRSLQDGEILRWVGHHQGGYPVEFYPLGVAWLDVLIWAVSLGSISILAAHKIAVILVFMLPSLSFWLLARGDRIHPSVAVLASAIHFSVPGHWLNGGYEELVGWGLVTNVAGASLALVASVALSRFMLNREFGMGVLATLAAASGAVTNPRSLFALVLASIAIVGIAALADRRRGFFNALAGPVVRVGVVGGIALLLSAPVVFALFRYNSLYFFLHYEFYEPLWEFWSASASAVTVAVLILAIAGVLGTFMPRLSTVVPVSRALAAALVAYVLFTIWVASASTVPPLVEQLEAPRLMPYQRQAMIWFGALAVWAGTHALARRLRSPRGRAALTWLVPAGVALFFLLAHVRPLAFVPDEQVALRDVSLTGNLDHATFERAVEIAAGARPDGTAIFVIGNRDDWWHQQLWAPSYTDARFFYDDWMWYWHALHAGPYTPSNGYWMPNPTDALEGTYLDDNGIGVVIVGEMWVPQGIPPRESARQNPRLDLVGTTGTWDVYTVTNPSSLVMNGERRPVEIDVGNHLITARFEEDGGTVNVRQNWHPRWTATADGEAVSIERRADGYMKIEMPPGASELRLEYSVTALDWAGRAGSILGIVFLGVGLLRGPAFLRRIDDRAGQPHGPAEGNTPIHDPAIVPRRPLP